MVRRIGAVDSCLWITLKSLIMALSSALLRRKAQAGRFAE
jgi:hypothetical protein